MTGFDWGPLSLSLWLATVTTVILLALGTPLAWWLSRTRRPWRGPVEALVALPLVLPPTVLGFYLLIALGARGWPGKWWLQVTGDTLAFSFVGLVIGSVLYSLPFVVQPLQTSFEALPRAPLEAAATLGAGRLDRFVSIVLPMCRRGFLTASILGFAHTVGEFGVVLMIGGNIPGRTRVVSIAVYDHVESLNYPAAHQLSAVLLLFSFAVLLGVSWLNRRTGVEETRL
ncbi:MAG: molybdate ABC transporter permease subunit [Thermoanaerobaculia bacterium]|nr:molybdate ABC transporter permease subunit [Thermoanaerobaculia bacterium]